MTTSLSFSTAAAGESGSSLTTRTPERCSGTSRYARWAGFSMSWGGGGADDQGRARDEANTWRDWRSEAGCPPTPVSLTCDRKPGQGTPLYCWYVLVVLTSPTHPPTHVTLLTHLGLEARAGHAPVLLVLVVLIEEVAHHLG